MRRHLLALKAEVVMGLHLVTRHRAPRLAAVLGLALVAGTAISRPADAGGRPVVLVAAALAVVGASRLLANGPALAAARMVTAPWWLVPVGRLVGAQCAVIPFALGVATLMAGVQATPGVWRVTGSAASHTTALAACTMALAPSIGASAAAALGLAAVWLGGGTPASPLLLIAGTAVGVGLGAWQVSVPLGERPSASGAAWR